MYRFLPTNWISSANFTNNSAVNVSLFAAHLNYTKADQLLLCITDIYSYWNIKMMPTGIVRDRMNVAQVSDGVQLSFILIFFGQVTSSNYTMWNITWFKYVKILLGIRDWGLFVDKIMWSALLSRCTYLTPFMHYWGPLIQLVLGWDGVCHGKHQAWLGLRKEPYRISTWIVPIIILNCGCIINKFSGS